MDLVIEVVVFLPLCVVYESAKTTETNIQVRNQELGVIRSSSAHDANPFRNSS